MLKNDSMVRLITVEAEWQFDLLYIARATCFLIEVIWKV